MDNYEIYINLRNKSKELYKMWDKTNKTIEEFISSLSYNDICKMIFLIIKKENFTNYSDINDFIFFIYDNSDCYTILLYANILDYENIHKYIIENKTQ